ncbi:MAG: ABC transporter permease [Dehalococcoidia bacterium]|nr:ABC transporter permease [Dehalococcoidia bacterium]
MLNLWNVTQKDLRLLYRDPLALVLLIIMPLALIVLLSTAFSNVLTGSTRIRIAVVDLDQSQTSGAVINGMIASDSLVIDRVPAKGSAFSRAQAAALLGGGERLAVLVIPAGFGEALAGGSHPALTYYADPAQARNGHLVAQAIQAAFQAAGANNAPAVSAVNVDEQPLVRGASLPSVFEQTVPGFTFMFVFWLAGLIAFSVFAERRVYGTWHRNYISPVSPVTIVSGKLIAAYVIGCAQVLALFVLGWLVYGMQLGDAPAIALVIGCFLLVPLAFGLCVAAFIQNQQVLGQFMNLTVVLLGALGGSMVPIFLLPGWMRAIARFTPTYWVMTAAQDLMFRGANLRDVTTNLVVLVAFAFALFVVGAAKFRTAT